jgi:hypothetical protein
MFIANWLIIIISLILIWSIWLNFAKEKQIITLQYSFNEMSDFAKNTLDEIFQEREELEGERDLVPFIISEPLTEWEQKVKHLLNMQYKAGVSTYKITDGAKTLGIK